MKNSSQLQKCMVIKSSPYKGWHLPFPHPALTLLPPDNSTPQSRALCIQNSPPSAVANTTVICKGPCNFLLHFPFASFWSGESR